jgi:hypothetical protein
VNPSKSVQQYAARFRVVIKAEKHGFFGDEWDWVAEPDKPSHFPNAGTSRQPVGCDPKICIRIVAERMGTGRVSPAGHFVPVERFRENDNKGESQ